MISVCMIVKDEQEHIGRCLENISNKTDYEIIVVDTGSVDRTKEIIKNYTDKVYDFKWSDDFSEARNFSISKASNDYVLIVDADEFLEDINTKKLRKLINKHPQDVGEALIKSYAYDDKGRKLKSQSMKIPRFFNRKLYHYERVIHEQIMPISGNRIINYYDLPLSFEHAGYHGTDEELSSKADRNIRLLLKEIENNKDPYIYYHLGKSHYMKKDYINAEKYFEESLKFNLDEKQDYVIDMMLTYGDTLIQLGKQKYALSFESVYDFFKTSPEFLNLMGYIYIKNGMLQKAIDEYKKATKLKNPTAEGTTTYLPNFNIGTIYEVLGEKEKAIEYYKKCGNYIPAKNRLGKLT